MAEKSKILFIGGTGYMGKFIVQASLKAGHPTFLLVRESSISDPVKGRLMKSPGVTLLHVYYILTFTINPDAIRLALMVLISCLKYGDLHNHGSLVKAIKQVDVVISIVGHDQLANQAKIIAAIKEAGNIKVLTMI
ncbi:hypothetical protein IFM89_017707 [Coptis chinensis]|uniref:NmrA-like domain-containing protein n=1 Tax=Coptis chinensis TaxID=261450 RepID=A0A835I4S3_9MAGN|nr:hypothetical protein IFM89_017707 [Coptis chinensis]